MTHRMKGLSPIQQFIHLSYVSICSVIDFINGFNQYLNWMVNVSKK
ncbi:hypothetical protein FIU95_11810 [Microbulbifer sp. THAF38]|nr:hypothetical protein FIU95_11810 [Microbulbifer sp. THAF38]